MSNMKVVILCGGKGTRSYPYTEYMPKVMMPVSGRPIIVHLMEIYAAQGYNEFVLAAGHRQEILRDYFHGRFEDWKIDIVDTGAESDTGERIRNCADYVGEKFFATYGDGLGNVDLKRLLDFHDYSGGLATLTSVPLRSQYGTVQFDAAGRVSDFVEKPIIDHTWINAGYFVFEKNVFSDWTGRNLESHVFPALARRGSVFTYQHDGFWKSMDTSKDQQELENIYRLEGAPWLHLESAVAAANG